MSHQNSTSIKELRMKQKFSKYISLFALCSFALVHADDANNGTGISPTFVARSQARYKVREVVGVTDFTHQYNQDSWYGTFAIIPGYMQTFRSGRIAQTLFGSFQNNTTTEAVANNCNNDCNTSCGRTILIQGSQFNTGTRANGAWLADYFYLPSTYSGSFSVNPKIKDFFIDFDYYSSLDSWLCGAYFRVYAPFVHTKWNLDFCETVEQVSSNTIGYPIGYFDCVEVPSDSLLKSFSEYAAGRVPSLTAATCVKPQALKFAKITKCSSTKNGLGDLRAELGWNFWQDDCSHLGVNIQAAAPTGTRRRAEFLFDAVVGNGKHWELGGGITGHWLLWQDDCENRHFGFYLDANFTHLFKAHEERTFDLRGKPNSRYMLAAEMGTNDSGLEGTSLTGPLAKRQFTGVYTPVANLTTFDLKVSVGVQTDLVAWFNYTACNWSFDFGYNFYGRSREKFDCSNNNCETNCTNAGNICDPNQRNTWVLKGDAREFGFTTTFASTPNTHVKLSASENSATICKGTNATATACVPGSSDTFYKNNCGIDHPLLAFTNSPAASQLVLFPGGTTITDPVYTSIQPIFITCDDVDFVRTRSITNAVFAHVSHVWDCECWTPYLGFGGFAEFGSNSTCNDSCNSTNNGCGALPTVTSTTDCNTNCDSKNSVNTSLSRWGIWFKGGVAFN